MVSADDQSFVLDPFIRSGTTAVVAKKLDKRFRSARKHTHNALDDAIEQAEIFGKMLEYGKKGE